MRDFFDRRLGARIPALLVAFACGGAAVAQVDLFDNGALINSAGTGVGGADESILETATLGDQDLGVSHGSQPFDERIADEFTVGDPAGWQIDSVVVYAYQTTTSTTSTITAVNLRIWNGPPGVGGSQVIFGNTTDDVLASSTWTGAYRVSEATSGNSQNRPIMANTLTVGTLLAPGTYWLDWQADGSLANDGPWAPPIVISGVGPTGNSRRFSSTTGWIDVVDSASGFPKGFPFLVQGTVPTAPSIAIPTLGDFAATALVAVLALAGVALLSLRGFRL